MEIKLKSAAELVGGNLVGDGDILIRGAAKIEDAKEGDLTFLYHPSYEKFFPDTKASAIIVNKNFNKTRGDIAYIETDNPAQAFHILLDKFFTPEFPLHGIDQTAFIHKEAKIGRNVAIGRNVVISAGCVIGDNTKIFHNTVVLENCSIGSDCLIFQNVSIRENCIIGNRAVIHPGAVIGSDGFGFERISTGEYKKIPQIGNVVIEDDVEIGANTTIDRAALGSTLIKKGVKLDNLVQIAHNVSVGENTVMSSQTGVSGSTKIGKNCILAGQAGLVGHIELADNVIVTAQSGVSKSLLKPGMYFGSPAKDKRISMKEEAHIRNLPEYAEKIKTLEKIVEELKEEIAKIKG